jgi:hypothetical protein
VRDQRDRHLLTDLEAFLQEHRRCGDLDAAVEGDRVWMTCTCGAAISRALEPARRQ